MKWTIGLTTWTVLGYGIVAVLVFALVVTIVVIALGLVLAEQRRYAAQTSSDQQRFIRTIETITTNNISHVSREVGDVVKDTVKTVVESMVNVMWGKPDENVNQPPEPTPENNLNDPLWYLRAPDTFMGDAVGVGDSVDFGRYGPVDAENMQRLGGDVLMPGEQMVPGVPLPNMDAENW